MVARQEWRWVTAWAALALLLANAPLLFAWALSTPEMSFGGAVYNVEDVHSYLANMREGWRGEWLYHNPYTPEEHPGSLIYLHYLLLGKAAAWSGLSLEATYHVARVVCGALLLFVVYQFLAQFTPYRAVRRIAFLLAAFSGGLGWLLIVLGRGGWLGSLPLDLISPEGYVFLTLYSPPHIALAMAGVLWGTVRVCRASNVKRQASSGKLETANRAREQVGAALGGGLAFAGVAVIGAFYLVGPLTVLCVRWLVDALQRQKIDWRTLALIALAGLPPAPLALYTLATFAGHPVYRAWAGQNQVRALHPLHYVAGYALPGALALLGISYAVRRRRHQRQRLMLPILWVALTPVFLALPVNVSRRLILGAQIPLCLLAAEGLVAALALPIGRSPLPLRLDRTGSRYGSHYTRRGLRRLLVAAVILAAVPTNLLLLGGTALQVARRVPPIYYSRAELAAMDWLAANTSPQDTVLCAYETGNILPARAGNRVVLGLGPQTVDVERKRDEVQRFYDSGYEGIAADDWRREMLQRYNVAYVLFGPHERALMRDREDAVRQGPAGNRGYDLGDATYLAQVYDKDEYIIYHVLDVQQP